MKVFAIILFVIVIYVAGTAGVACTNSGVCTRAHNSETGGTYSITARCDGGGTCSPNCESSSNCSGSSSCATDAGVTNTASCTGPGECSNGTCTGTYNCTTDPDGSCTYNCAGTVCTPDALNTCQGSDMIVITTMFSQIQCKHLVQIYKSH